MTQFVTAIYRSHDHACKAIDALIESSFAHTDISVLKTDGERVENIEVEHRTNVPYSLAAGGLAGSTVGALGAALIATGAIGGPLTLVAAGPVLAALQGAFAGGAAGSLAGALVGLGYWKEEAAFEASEIQKGAILVGVTVPSERVEEAKDLLHRSGGLRVRA